MDDALSTEAEAGVSILTARRSASHVKDVI